jgi:hypothetical protein
MFSLQQNQSTRGWNRFCPEVVWGWGWGGGSGLYNVYTCKNDKIKKKFKASEIFGDPPREKRKNCLHM